MLDVKTRYISMVLVSTLLLLCTHYVIAFIFQCCDGMGETAGRTGVENCSDDAQLCRVRRTLQSTRVPKTYSRQQ